MGRTLEAIFRRPVQLLLLVLLLPMMGLAIAYFVIPRTYQSTATVWALQRYVIIGATGIESNLQATPAETQAAALSELLQTHVFTIAVANGIGLASTLNLSSSVLSDPQQLQDALYQEISHNVQVTALGNNLFEVNYTNRNPQIAQQIVAAVIQNFGFQSMGFTVVEGQRLLENYQAQLASAQTDTDAAVKVEQQYILAHPGEAQNQLINDPQYALLDAKRLQAQSTLQNIQNSIATLNEAISVQGQSAASLFQVLDDPQVPSRSVSRVKQYLIAGGLGIGIALLACILYILILVRRDHSIYTSQDLRQVTAFPLVMQSPHLRPATIRLVASDFTYQVVMLREGKNRANGQLY